MATGMLLDIKPIETIYKGYRFRSRLEARWAVFFDALDVKWEYEPEGFDLGDAGKYLPDFHLPDHRLWIEVKPDRIESDDFGRIAAFARRAPIVTVTFTASDIEKGRAAHDWNEDNAPWDRVGTTRRVREAVWIASGFPYATFDQYGYGESLSYVLIGMHGAKGNLPHYFDSSGYYMGVFVQCRGCDYIGIETRNGHFPGYNDEEMSGGICHSEHSGYGGSPKLKAAYAAARRARFEYGENGT